MRRMGVLLAAILFSGGACGSDDDEPLATDSPPATDAPTVATDTEPAAGVGGGDALGPIPTGDSDSSWCTSAAEAEMAFDGLDNVDFNNPVALESAYRETRRLIQEARAAAPPELAGPVTVNIQAIDIFIAEFEKVSWSYFDVDLSALSDIEGELSESGSAIDRYNFYVCNFDNGYDPEEVDDDAANEPIFGSGSIREQAIEELVTTGLTPEDAACVWDRIETLGVDITTTAVDPAKFIQLLRDCDVSPEMITLFGG